MQALLAPLKELAEYDEVRKIVRQGKGTVALSGCVDSQKLHMIYGLSDGLKYKVIVTYNDLKAKEIYEEYRFYDRNVMLYPAKDLIFFQADIHGNQLVQERIKTLRRVVEGKPVTIVTTYAALMTPQVLWEEKDIIHTERGGSLDESKLASRLVAMGYEKAYQVESPGQFSVRGGIVDIFDLTEENPYRIELWGDEVESIRSFDILSQRSIEKLESITVYPATEFVLSEEQIRKGIARLEKEAAKQEKIFRDAHQPEEAHRIATQVSELKEQLLEFQSKANLEGYIRYFYENTVTMPELLADTSALLDTSFSLGSLTPRDEALPLDRQMLSDEAFVSLVRAFGAERILFGSDCPWGSPQNDLQHIRRLPLTDEEKAAILGGNAKRILGI